MHHVDITFHTYAVTKCHARRERDEGTNLSSMNEQHECKDKVLFFYRWHILQVAEYYLICVLHWAIVSSCEVSHGIYLKRGRSCSLVACCCHYFALPPG